MRLLRGWWPIPVAVVALLIVAALADRRPVLPGKGWEVAVVVEGKFMPQIICRDPEVDREHMRITCYRRRLSD